MALPPDVVRVFVAIADELDAAIAPVVRAAQHPASLQRLLHQVGWDVTGLLSADQQAVVAAVAALDTSVARVMAGPVAVDDIAQLADAVADAVVALTEAAAEVEPIVENALVAGGAALPTGVAADLAGRLVADLAELLLLRWIQAVSPTLLAVTRMVGLVTVVRRPALYLNDPPEEPPPAPDGAADAPTPMPVRWAMQRAGLNRDGLTRPLTFGIGSFLEELPRDAYRSPATFVAALQALLTRRIERLLDELARRPIGAVGVGVTGQGVSVTAANWLPTTFVDWDTPIDVPLEGPNGPLPLPLVARIERDTWWLLWDPAGERDTLELVAGVLSLVDRLDTSAVMQPGISLSADATDLASPTVLFAMTLGLELQLPSATEPVELALTAAADVDDDGVDLVLRAEALGDLEVPLLVPGLTGLAIGVRQPSLELVANLDEDPRLDVHATLDGFTLRLPTELFRAAERTGDRWTIVDGVAPKVTMTLPSQEPLLSLGVATTTDGLAVDRFDFLPDHTDPTASWQLGFECDPIYVGAGDIATGLVIEITSTTYTAEPGEPFGRIDVPSAQVHLPPDLPAAPEAIVIEHATIDESGFSGEVSVAFATHRNDQELEPLFGVIPIAFQSIALVVEQNLPTAFELRALAQLPYFDEWVDMTIAADDEFNLLFHLESVDPEGITLTKEELLLLNFRSATVAWTGSERRLELGLSGGIEPLLWNADGLEWPRLDVTNLVIDQRLPATFDEPVEPPILRFEEAWLDLKDLATLDLFGFHFELNRLGIGYIEATDELWVDLTGSLRLIEQIPIGLGVEGFRITWPRRIYEELGITTSSDGVSIDLTVDEMLQLASRIQVRFDGIYLFYGIPQAIEFEGYIRFIKTAQKVGFAGDVALRVPTSGLAIEAGLMVGMNFEDPPYPFLYVYFGILLPSGIPLGQSGLAFKGAKGLFGLNVEPARDPDQNPYYDWYLRGPIEGAHPTNKWRDRIWSIALGAGITITTTDGKILGVQGLLALAIPGPIIFVEGKALVFDGVFPMDSPLKALAYFDGTELTTQLNIEASLELIEGVVDVSAGIEAFFDFRNLLNWHLYLGQDEPTDRRVRANFLDLPALGWLFSADAYLMIDMPAADDVGDSIDLDDLTVQARMGVHIGFEPPAIDLVVASAEVHAVLDGGGLVTINPFLFTGGVELDALIDIDAFGLVVVGAQATASMSIEGALPLDVRADLAVSVDLPVPDLEEIPLVGDELASALDWFEETVVDLPEVPDHLEVEIPFHWRLDRPPELAPIVSGVSLDTRWAQGGIEAQAAGLGAVADAPVVALDARPVIRFDQNVNTVDGMEFGGFDAGGQQRFTAGQLAFVPTLTGVRLFELPAHEFVDGVSEQWVEVASTGDGGAAGELWGMFRPAGEFTDGSRASRRTLEMWSANPFEHLAAAVPLAIPAGEADDWGQVEPLASIGVGDIAWCNTAGARERCLGRDEIERALRSGRPQPTAVTGTGATPLEHLLDWGALGHGLTMAGTDIRLGSVGDRFVVSFDARNRDRLATLRFPSRAASIRIRVLAKVVQARGRRRILSGRVDSGVVLQDVALGDVSVDEVTTIELSDPAGFDEVVIGGRSAVHLVEVCWTPAVEAASAAARGRACLANELVSERAGDAGTMLSPGSYYRLEIDTSVVMDEDASDAAAALLASLPGFAGGVDPYRIGRGGPFTATDTYHFRTEGPPADLRPYVTWMSPADGERGTFTEDDIAIRFNRPYLHRFYPDDDNGAPGPAGSPHALQAFLVDAEGRTRSDWFLNWTTAASATLAPEEQHWFDDIAPDSAPGVTPPPDDVLEIRRRLDVRSFADIPAAAWTAVTIPRGRTTTLVPRRRAQWKRVGSDAVAARLHGSPDTHLSVASSRSWGAAAVDIDVDVDAVSPGWSVGLAVLYVDERHHHLVRVVVDEPPARRISLRPTARVEIVRVDDGTAKVLAADQVDTAAAGNGAQLRVAVSTAATGMRIDARVGRARITAVSPLAPADGAVALLASGTDATFRNLAITTGASGPLEPDTRYTLMVAGGSGGPTRRRDGFESPLPWWTSTAGWTYTTDGLRASGSGAMLSFDEPVDDGEVSTVLVADDGDALAIGLRTADDRRGPDGTGVRHRYELLVTRQSGVCAVELRLRDGLDGSLAVLAAAETAVGAATRIPVRVRMIGDQLRVWMFDRRLVDTTLQATTLPDGPTGAVLRQGSLDWRSVAGTPTLRSVHVCEPALLRTTFTTGPSATFAERASQLRDAGSAMITSVGADEMGGSITAAAAAQSAMAERSAALHAVMRRHALKRADLAAVEAARHALADARARLDIALGDAFVDGGLEPLLAPVASSLDRIETPDGEIVGWLLRCVEPLDPRRSTSAADAPLPSVGRTSFELVGNTGPDPDTAWIASADGTSVLVYRTTAGGQTPLAVDASATAIRVTYERDHLDDESSIDHTLDRPYQLARGSRDPVTVTIQL